MHLLSTTASTASTTSSSRSISGSRRAISLVLSFADSDLAGLAAAGRRARRRCRACGSRSCAISASDVGRSLDRHAWRASQGDRGAAARRAGLVALRRRPALRRSPASAGSRWRCCRARTATTRGWRRSSTLPPEELAALLAYFREGGRENLRALLRRLARHAGAERRSAPSRGAVPRTGGYTARPGRRSISMRLSTALAPRQARRAGRVLSLDAARRRRCADRRAVRGAGRARAGAGAAVRPEPQGCGSRRPSCARRMARLAPAVIVTTTAFAAAGGADELDAARGRRRSGAASGRRHDAARGLGRRPARAWRRRSRHACGAAGARRARARGRYLFQGCASNGVERLGVHRAWSTGRSRSGSHAVADRIAALVRLQATPRGGAAARGADAGLSRRAGPDRLCGRARRAGERQRDARRSCAKRATRVDAPRDVAGAAASAGGGNRVSMLRRNLSRGCSPDFPSESASESTPPGARPRRDPDVRGGAFRFRARDSATSSSRCRRTAGASSGPPRRLSRSVLAAAPCAGGLRALAAASRRMPTPSCTWARTARWNGCRARPWR